MSEECEKCVSIQDLQRQLDTLQDIVKKNCAMIEMLRNQIRVVSWFVGIDCRDRINEIEWQKAR